jgi:hypothetical protein
MLFLMILLYNSPDGRQAASAAMKMIQQTAIDESVIHGAGSWARRTGTSQVLRTLQLQGNVEFHSSRPEDTEKIAIRIKIYTLGTRKVKPYH